MKDVRDEQAAVAETVTVKDRVAFALALTLGAGDYFRGFRSLGDVYKWLQSQVAPWVAGLLGNGAIVDDALDAVLVRTIHAVAQQHFGVRMGSRDPVLTALGEGNNAGRQVAERRIGLAEIPLLYPHRHLATMSIIVAALRKKIKHEDSFDVKTFRAAYQTTEGGVPWHEVEAGVYALSPDYTPPAFIQALLDKTFTQGAAEVVRAAARPLTVEERLLRLEQQAGLV